MAKRSHYQAHLQYAVDQQQANRPSSELDATGSSQVVSCQSERKSETVVSCQSESKSDHCGDGAVSRRVIQSINQNIHPFLSVTVRSVMTPCYQDHILSLAVFKWRNSNTQASQV
jgi:hypothetical protein